MLELLNELDRLNDPLWDEELFIEGVQFWPMTFDIDILSGRRISAIGTDGSMLTFVPDDDLC